MLVTLDTLFQQVRAALSVLLAEHDVHVPAGSLVISIRSPAADEVGHDDGSGIYYIQILSPLQGTAVLLWTQPMNLRVLLQAFTVTTAFPRYPVSGGSGMGSGHFGGEMHDQVPPMGTPVDLQNLTPGALLAARLTFPRATPPMERSPPPDIQRMRAELTESPRASTLSSDQATNGASEPPSIPPREQRTLRL